MKILALMGSPRKEGNTDILVDQFLQGSQSKGHKAEKLYLYDLKISPCVDCRTCKKGDLVCKVKDDMQKIYPLMEGADIIVFGTPVYWWGPTGPMKLLMDRMRPFAANKKLRGKKAVVIAPSGDPPDPCWPIVEMFRLSFDYLGVDFAGKLLSQAYDKGEIRQTPAVLKQAYDLGASL